MPRSSLRFLVLTGALLVGACLPIPHRAFRTPLIQGRLLQGGRPLEAVAVRVVAEPEEGACEGRYTGEAVTDQEGRFVLCPIPDFQMFVTVFLAHRIFDWNVCVETGGSRRVIHTGEQYTLGDAGPRMISTLDCELESAGPCSAEKDVDITPEKIRSALAGVACKGVGP